MDKLNQNEVEKMKKNIEYTCKGCCLTFWVKANGIKPSSCPFCGDHTNLVEVLK